MANLEGTTIEYHTQNKFVVEIDGFEWISFATCSELKMDSTTIVHRQGGSNLENKQRGLVTYPTITLTRGSTTQNNDMYNWIVETHGLGEQFGEVASVYKRNLDIVQLDQAGQTAVRWGVYEAFPKGFTPGQWDANANEVTIESIEIECSHFEKIDI